MRTDGANLAASIRSLSQSSCPVRSAQRGILPMDRPETCSRKAHCLMASPTRPQQVAHPNRNPQLRRHQLTLLPPNRIRDMALGGVLPPNLEHPPDSRVDELLRPLRHPSDTRHAHEEEPQLRQIPRPALPNRILSRAPANHLD